MVMLTEGSHAVAPDVRTSCICPNGGLPDADGIQIFSPSCRVHYAERAVGVAAPDRETEITQAEIAEWQRREKKRVAYPKMTVAKQPFNRRGRN